jgi:hypothetical protein
MVPLTSETAILWMAEILKRPSEDFVADTPQGRICHLLHYPLR